MLKLKHFAMLFCATLGTLSLAEAATQTSPRYLITPNCLLTKIPNTYQTLAQVDRYTLIKADDAIVSQLVQAKTAVPLNCSQMKDVTEAYLNPKTKHFKSTDAEWLKSEISEKKAIRATSTLLPTLSHKDEVNLGIQKINPTALWNRLTTLTALTNRYAYSDEGLQAAEWIQTTMRNMAKETGHSDVSIMTVSTGGSYTQPSVVVKLGTGNEPGIVIGAHLDTLKNYFWSTMPGADDDGSGSASVLEAAHAILSSGLHFNKPIYFIWYAAEEEGLVGSQHVVNYFDANKIPVEAVIHLDMTGYRYRNDPTIWMVTDHVNEPLTEFIAKLIQTYIKVPVKQTQCGYACSDHASWTDAGVRAAIPFESQYETYNPNIHSSSDTMDQLSLEHMTNFSKIAVAFAIELGNGTTKERRLS